MPELGMDEITVVCEQHPNGEMDITFTPVSENAAECLNVAMDLKGMKSVEGMVNWLIMTAAEEVNEKYPDSLEGKGRGASNEQIEMFASSAIVNRVNEILSDVKEQ